jgi:hypothetical protein
VIGPGVVVGFVRLTGRVPSFEGGVEGSVEGGEQSSWKARIVGNNGERGAAI